MALTVAGATPRRYAKNMRSILTIIFIAIYTTVSAQESPAEVYYEKLALVEAEYRVNLSKALKKADRVELFIVTFDGIEEPDEDPFANEPSIGDTESISISPYKMQTKIIQTKELEINERDSVLKVLSKQITVKEHSGGAFCHYPIHGIRIYKGEEILHEGTFCWVCGNFSITYPVGSAWLDTTLELKTLFNKILPIPKSEIERFHKKHPSTKPK